MKLYPYQEAALYNLKNGAILAGGVGSGKSAVALAYYIRLCNCGLDSTELDKPFSLYIVTTALKRDLAEWEKEASKFKELWNKKINVFSWNTLHKLENIKGSFFIFDEQRLVGSGKWVKSFLKISKTNRWLLLSATPGDNWSDYIPVFIANGFYRNRSEFLHRHAVFSKFTKFPKIDRFVETDILENYRKSVLVKMDYSNASTRINENVNVNYDRDLYKKVLSRWDPFSNRPIKEVSSYCYLLRKVVNSDPSRVENLYSISEKHNRLIVFYNFDYELEIIKNSALSIRITEYNGHRHDKISSELKWIHLVQYNAGNEGWNCTETNAMVFYSLCYSHKVMTQAAGRIDRLSSSFKNLYYYFFISPSSIDKAIETALKEKKIFNEKAFAK